MKDKVGDIVFSTPTSFEFNGKTTEDFGLYRGYLTGLPSYTTGINKENKIEKVLGIDKAFSYGDENKLFSFQLEIFSEEPLTLEDRKKIRKWFEIDCFADLRFANSNDGDGYEDVVFLCKLDGESEMIDFGEAYGMTLNMLSLLPYPTTNDSSQYFDLSSNTGTTTIDVLNIGNYNAFFSDIDIRIEMQGSSTSIKLENLNAGGYSMEFTDLTVEDIIIVDYNEGQVYLENDTSYNLLQNYTFPDNFNGFFGLVSGLNRIKVTGECTIEFVARYPLSI